MNSSTIRLDCGLYGEEVIARTAHRYSGQFGVFLRREGAETLVVLTPLDGTEPPSGLEARFVNDALDERLRELVRNETRGIHEELIKAALREATPTRPGIRP